MKGRKPNLILVLFSSILFTGLCIEEDYEKADIAKALKPPEEPTLKTEFPHEEHTEEMGLECKECHHETNAAVLKQSHKQYFEDASVDCAVCHYNSKVPRDPMDCLECHPPSPENPADERLSAKVVIHKICWNENCHAVGKGKKASSECGLCHPDYQVKEKTEDKRE